MRKVKVFMVLAALLTSMMMPVVHAEEQSYVWVEAEDTAKTASVGLVEKNSLFASGKNVLFCGAKVSEVGTNAEYSATVTLDIPQEGEYDIWALVLGYDKNVHGFSKYSVDGETEWVYKPLDVPANYCPSGDITQQHNIKYPVFKQGLAFGWQYDMHWVRIKHKLQLSADAHTVKYIVQPSTNYYFGAIDCVTAVPSSWNWQPKNKLEKPTKHYWNADENGVFWMEAEEANSDIEFSVKLKKEASNSQLNEYVLKSPTDAQKAVKPEITFDFNVTKEGTYDVWVLTSALNKGHISPAFIGIDAESTQLTDNISGYTTANSKSAYTYGMLGTAFDMRWIRAKAAHVFDEGNHYVKYSTKVADIGFFDNAVDCVVVVPTSMNWMPDGSIEKPQESIKGYAWIEAESAKNMTEDYANSYVRKAYDSLVANNSNYSLIFENMTNAETRTLLYDFELANDGEYDIWYFGTKVDQAYLGRLWMGIDKETVFTDASDQQNQVFGNKVFGSDVQTINGQTLAWRQLKTGVNIDKGEHSLNMTFVKTQLSSADAPKLYFTFDALAIVPSGWNISASTQEISEYPQNLAVALDAKEQADYLRNKIFDSDISLPGVGTAGSQLSYTVDYGEDYINAEGTILSRPLGENEWVSFYITAKKEYTTSDYKYTSNQEYTDFQILKLEDYELKGFAVTYSDGAALGETLEGGKTIKAGVNTLLNNTSISKNITVVLALYNEDDKLVDIDLSEPTSMSTEETPVEATIILPDNVDGYYVKAFAWDSVSGMNPYLAPISNITE